MLRTRLLSALVLLTIAGWTVWAGSWWLFAVVLVVAGLAGYEFGQLMRRGGYAPSTLFILLIISTLALDAQLPLLDIAQPAVAAILILSISRQILQLQRKAPVADWALTIAGGLYVGWLSSYAIRLRALPDGLAWTALALLATAGSDTIAYFAGNILGHHKLWPRLSPHKTWEGVWGGIAGGLLTGAVVGHLTMQWMGAIGLSKGLLVGLLAGVVGPFGDLAISMMKRQARVKDSGHIIPGHGGLLDRTDSLLFVVVTTYYYAIWFAG